MAVQLPQWVVRTVFIVQPDLALSSSWTAKLHFPSSSFSEINFPRRSVLTTRRLRALKFISGGRTISDLLQIGERKRDALLKPLSNLKIQEDLRPFLYWRNPQYQWCRTWLSLSTLAEAKQHCLRLRYSSFTAKQSFSANISKRPFGIWLHSWWRLFRKMALSQSLFGVSPCAASQHFSSSTPLSQIPFPLLQQCRLGNAKFVDFAW